MTLIPWTASGALGALAFGVGTPARPRSSPVRLKDATPIRASIYSLAGQRRLVCSADGQRGRSCPELPRRVYDQLQLTPLLVPGQEIAGRH